MCLGNTDECPWFGLCQASFQVLDPQARINQDRHGADLEQGKGEGKELRTRRDHQGRAHPLVDAAAH